jgi:hypothetical protein
VAGVVGVVAGVAAPSLEQAARVSIADARTSTLPFRAIDGWYFVPTATQWATSRSNRNAETRGDGSDGRRQPRPSFSLNSLVTMSRTSSREQASGRRDRDALLWPTASPTAPPGLTPPTAGRRAAALLLIVTVAACSGGDTDADVEPDPTATTPATDETPPPTDVVATTASTDTANKEHLHGYPSREVCPPGRFERLWVSRSAGRLRQCANRQDSVKIGVSYRAEKVRQCPPLGSGR